jgi:D-3-phosphoglycerate dehydrogenase
MTLPQIWFERPPLPEFAAEVAAECTVLGPTADDPDAGLATVAGVLAGLRRYDAAFMDRAPELVVIARTGIGYDAVDVPEATRRGIAVCNAPEAPTISTAEHTIALILAVTKRLPSAQAALREGARNVFAIHTGIELDGKVLGLVGFGRIGRRVATIARGLGMEVIVYDPYLDASSIPSEITEVETLATLLAAADVVSVHVPLSDPTRGLFGAAEFAAMKPGAVFINTARGGLVDQDALLAALDAGHLFGAGLDVTTPEPLPPAHPLLHRPDVLVTPHVASATREGKARMFRVALDQALAVIEGRRPEHLVNPEVWDQRTRARAGASR